MSETKHTPGPHLCWCNRPKEHKRVVYPLADLLEAAEMAWRDCDAAASSISEGNPEGIAEGLATTAMLLRAAIRKARGEG